LTHVNHHAYNVTQLTNNEQQKMFIDYLSVYQDHKRELPYISETLNVTMCRKSGEPLRVFQPIQQFEGSYTTKINILVSDRRISMWGNPSRINRLDNLHGFQCLEDCIYVYNKILDYYALPHFTKNSRRLPLDSQERIIPDGAIITRIDLTTNKSVGENNEQTFIKALSTQPFRNQYPRLHQDNNTVDWVTRQKKLSSYIYPSIYNKHAELILHTSKFIKNNFDTESLEYKYFNKLLTFVKKTGVVRFETKLRSRLLTYLNQKLYGRIDMNILRETHNELLNIPNKLQVTSFDLHTIADQLVQNGILPTMRRANTTAFYAVRWSHGEIFDLSKSQVKIHRSYLRKIGIDISLPCDTSKFTFIKQTSEKIIELKDVELPDFYQLPNRNIFIPKTLN